MASMTLEQVSKTYGMADKASNPAVRSMDLAVRDGEIVALLGSSGCGKTSTLRMIAGFETVSSGTIRIGARVVNALKPAQRNVAMAFEGYALYPPLSVADNIGFSLLRNKTPRPQVREQVRRVAELLEITDLLDSYPPMLSGGQQQRVSLARALARPADLYLFDEPMSQLEPQLRALLRGRIKEYLIERGMTSILVTHDQTEAMALSDRIAVMSDGVLRQFASPSDLQDRPADLFVAGFVGEPAMNLLPARVSLSGDTLAAIVTAQDGSEAWRATFGPLRRIDSAARLRDGMAVHLGLRPQRIRLGHGPEDANGMAPGVHIRGTLAFRQWLGDQTHLGVDVGGHTLLVVTDGAMDLADHVPLTLHLPADALHLFDSASQTALLHGADLG